MHESSHVSVKVEPRSTSRLSSALFILPLFYLRDYNLRALTFVAKNASVDNNLKSSLCVWGARDGPVVGTLLSHQCGPSSIPCVDAIFGLGLLLFLSFASRGFSPGTPVFPSPQKPTFPNSNSTRNQVHGESFCGCATSKSLYIYLSRSLLSDCFPSLYIFMY